jgi:hypothetical protein
MFTSLIIGLRLKLVQHNTSLSRTFLNYSLPDLKEAEWPYNSKESKHQSTLYQKLGTPSNRNVARRPLRVKKAMVLAR